MVVIGTDVGLGTMLPASGNDFKHLHSEMEKLNHPAILVVDMLNDFVTGSIGCPRAVEILPATARLLEAARERRPAKRVFP